MAHQLSLELYLPRGNVTLPQLPSRQLEQPLASWQALLITASINSSTLGGRTHFCLWACVQFFHNHHPPFLLFFPSKMVAPNNGDNTNTNGAAPGTTPEAELAPDAMAASQKEQEFAELGDNPFPELAFDPDCLPEPVAAVDGHNAHDDVGSPLTPDGRGSLAAHDANSNNNAISHAAAIEPDASDNRGPAVVYAEPNRSWVAKHKAWVIVGVILTAIITIGVAVGVVLVEKAKHGGGGGGAGGDGATSTSLTRVPSSPVPSGSPRTSSTDTSATTTSTGSSVSSPSLTSDASLESTSPLVTASLDASPVSSTTQVRVCERERDKESFERPESHVVNQTSPWPVFLHRDAQRMHRHVRRLAHQDILDGHRRRHGRLVRDVRLHHERHQLLRLLLRVHAPRVRRLGLDSRRQQRIHHHGVQYYFGVERHRRRRHLSGRVHVGVFQPGGHECEPCWGAGSLCDCLVVIVENDVKGEKRGGKKKKKKRKLVWVRALYSNGWEASVCTRGMSETHKRGPRGKKKRTDGWAPAKERLALRCTVV